MWSDPFYSPDHFTYFWEYAYLNSDDPQERQKGVEQMIARVEAGDCGAMIVLAKHFYCGKDRDLYTACKWYLKAAEHGMWEGQAALVRFYKHPEDEEMQACVQRLRDEGYTDEYVLVTLRNIKGGE